MTRKRLSVSVGENYGCQEVEASVGAGYWRCRCKLCGAISVKRASVLLTGEHTYCRKGCQKLSKAFREQHKAEYAAWAQMKYRCSNPSHRAYPSYGGKGIKVCDAWVESFQAFMEDMGPKPSKSHSLDRVDNDGDYEPGNCRWATSKQQNRNTRQNRIITFNGQSKTLSEWAEDLDADWTTIQYRLKQGWPIERALTEPPHHKGRRVSRS